MTGRTWDRPARIVRRALLIAMVATPGAGLARADETAAPLPRATAETIYVPAYSQVLTHTGRAQSLASTMAVHNVDPEITITLISVDYFDQSGSRVKAFLTEPVSLAPFQSEMFLVPINEQAGGFGANYIVEWQSDAPALPPIAEAVMNGGGGNQGISFTSSGRVIARQP